LNDLINILFRNCKFRYKIYLTTHVNIEELTTVRMIPPGTTSPQAEVLTKWSYKSVDITCSALDAFMELLHQVHSKSKYLKAK